MVSYKIEFSSEAERFLERTDVKTSLRIVKAVGKLSANPRPPGCKKLVGAENEYRIRIGDYRVIYQIRKAVLMVFVIRIGHRKDIYR
jgi:mRNA interferase RelE/StbE